MLLSFVSYIFLLICVIFRWIIQCLTISNILFYNFCEHGPITIAIDCNGLSLLIFEEKWPNYESGPKSAPNSDSLRVFCAKKAIILLAYIPAKIKMSFIWKDDGRIKLIICQIRHELSITIHEISTSWKNFRWRTLYIYIYLACRRNTFLCRHPTNNSPTVPNRSSEVANDQLCGW